MLDKVLGSGNEPVVSNQERVSRVNEVRNEQPLDFQREFQQGLTREKTEKIIDSMNDFLKASSSHLKFELHEELQEYYVTLVDDVTNEVVREIPQKKLLDMYVSMAEYLGILVDRKV